MIEHLFSLRTAAIYDSDGHENSSAPPSKANLIKPLSAPPDVCCGIGIVRLAGFWGVRSVREGVDHPAFVEAAPSSLYKSHRFPVEIICDCVWLYHRFPLSLRDVEQRILYRTFLVRSAWISVGRTVVVQAEVPVRCGAANGYRLTG